MTSVDNVYIVTLSDQIWFGWTKVIGINFRGLGSSGDFMGHIDQSL